MNQREWIRAKRLVTARDGHCIRCMGNEETDVHHRVLKGVGGTVDPEINYGLANLILLCRECHSWVHEHPAESYELGFLVHSWERPEVVPVVVKPGTFYIQLTKDGSMEITKPLVLF